MHDDKNTDSLSSLVQFPMKVGILPKIWLPSILLQQQMKMRILHSKIQDMQLLTKSITYKSVKFFRFPNDSGTVPVKLFAERRLLIKEKHGEALPLSR